MAVFYLVLAILLALTLNAQNRWLRVAGTALVALSLAMIVLSILLADFDGTFAAIPADAPLSYRLAPAILNAQAALASAAIVFLAWSAWRQARRPVETPLPVRNTQSAYGRVSRYFHWTIAVLMFVLIPIGLFMPILPESNPERAGFIAAHQSLGLTVLALVSNPQSYLCGFCAGLLFLPTTVGDMIWGVPMLQQAFGVDHATAVNRAAMIPLGWVFGAPMLGYVADRMGRRKPVLIASAFAMLVIAAAILYLPAGYIPPYIGGLLFGFVSGAAMIPYAIIKEVNPDRVKGSATGATNFLVFSLSAIAAPLAGWALQKLSGGQPLDLKDFQQWGFLGLAAIAVGIVLAFFLKETGSAARTPLIAIPIPPLVIGKPLQA